MSEIREQNTRGKIKQLLSSVIFNLHKFLLFKDEFRSATKLAKNEMMSVDVRVKKIVKRKSRMQKKLSWN